jgi:hypothetical protein
MGFGEEFAIARRQPTERDRLRISWGLREFFLAAVTIEYGAQGYKIDKSSSGDI